MHTAQMEKFAAAVGELAPSTRYPRRQGSETGCQQILMPPGDGSCWTVSPVTSAVGMQVPPVVVACTSTG